MGMMIHYQKLTTCYNEQCWYIDKMITASAPHTETNEQTQPNPCHFTRRDTHAHKGIRTHTQSHFPFLCHPRLRSYISSSSFFFSSFSPGKIYSRLLRGKVALSGDVRFFALLWNGECGSSHECRGRLTRCLFFVVVRVASRVRRQHVCVNRVNLLAPISYTTLVCPFFILHLRHVK